jgi:NADH:ubiquinone oxidoreductase subunit E
MSPDQETPVDLASLNAILEEFAGQQGAVIPILQRAQDAYGYLPKEILTTISEKTGLHPVILLAGGVP